MLKIHAAQVDDEHLTFAEWETECVLGKQELMSGQVRAARQRFMALLERVEARRRDSLAGLGSYEHSMTLYWLARCAEVGGNKLEEMRWLWAALRILDGLLATQPQYQRYRHQQQAILADMSRASGQQRVEQA